MDERSLSSGFTLIEVLVALLMLGLSVLGYAALQTQALAVTQQAYWRAQAYDLAEQIAVALRSNPSQQSLFLQSDVWQMPDAPLSLNCVGRQICTPEQLAQADIDHLKTQAFLQLPQPQIAVSACAAVATQLCVQVAWLGNAASPCDLTSEACLSVPLEMTL